MKKTETKIVWLALNAKYSHTSLAIRYLREACRGLGKQELLELTINHQLLDILGQVYKSRPDILSISCYIWNIELVKQLLPLLAKVLPETVIICGGPEVSYDTAAFMQEFPQVDYVQRGEGEEVMPWLIKNISEKRKLDGVVPGLAYRQAGEIVLGRDVTVLEMSRVPFPYLAEEMADIKERILYYETSRGCPFSCAYCLSCATKGVRYLPWERVREELDFFVRHDVRQVKFVDRTFNANKKHFVPILQYLLALPPECRTNFHFEIAIDYLDEEVTSLLAKLPKGRVQLEVGIQSTNEASLKAIRRHNDWAKIASNVQRISAVGNIHVHVDLIIGLPEEDLASFAKSFNDVYQLHADQLQLGFLKFLRGAAMMSMVKEGEYLYMDSAPYEILANKWLTYGEISWLKIFEQVFELYANAHRCQRTIAYLMEYYTAGNAFNFYRDFTDYWLAKGYEKIAHKTSSLYGYLLDFAVTKYGAAPEVADALLRFDALLSDGGRIRPEELKWTGKELHPVINEFWKSGRAKDYLPDFVFTNWRAIRLKYHIEIFAYDVINIKNITEKQVLLFEYGRDAVKWQPISLKI